MGQKYYVSNASEYEAVHTVHREDCYYMPADKDIKYIGVFESTKQATGYIQRSYQNVVGCYFCCKETFSKK